MTKKKSRKPKKYEAHVHWESESRQRQRLSLRFPYRRLSELIVAVLVALYLFNCSTQITAVACVADALKGGTQLAAQVITGDLRPLSYAVASSFTSRVRNDVLHLL